MIEVNSLNNRINNIELAYSNTAHNGLKKRLINENKSISQRLNEIYSTAKFIRNKTIDKISISDLLVEKCERIIAQKRMEKNLFFL